MQDNILEMHAIVKRFGNVCANDNVSLEVKRNEILSLLGENGAGKSTLMKILFGLYDRDGGSVTIDGHELPMLYSPAAVIQLGVSMVHQHFKLVEPFSVAQNIILGEEQTVSPFFYSKDLVEQRVAELCEEFNLKISPKSIVADLPLGARQHVEILKALYRNSRVLILDEPTTVLTPQETDELFTLLRDLRAKGITIIIITHKLKEVMAISDRVMVMRQGRVRAMLQTRETNVNQLANLMVGREVTAVQVTPRAHKSDRVPALSLSNIETQPHDENCPLKGLCLDLYAGCIVGVAGIDGNGQRELVEVLTGIEGISAGSIKIGDRTIVENTSAVMRSAGIRSIPDDRHRQGLVLPLTVQDNIMLGYRHDERFRRGGAFRMKKVKSFVDTLISEFDITPSDPATVIRNVSGGNQQKVVLARELTQPELQIVVASQPTRGLDVGATCFTHETLLELRSRNKAILLISCDLDEIHALSDEIAVMYNGKIVVQKAAADFDNMEIGLYMGGDTVKEVIQ